MTSTRAIEEIAGEVRETVGRYRKSRIVRSALGALAMCSVGTALVATVFRVMMPAGADLARLVHPGPPKVIRPHMLNAGAMPPAAPAPRSKPAQRDNTLTYRADRLGHFVLDAAVNGASVRFMLDTGATMVTLSPDDARTAGINVAGLRYDETVTTANGPAHVARVMLRDVRLNQLSVGDVPAIVMQEPLDVSLLGVSFLKRLDGYGIRDGVLTIEW